MAGFIGASLALVGLTLLVLRQVFRDEGEHRALWIAAAIAVIVQLGAFAIARALARRNLMAGWGAGVALRFAALAVVALGAVPRLGLPPAASLIGLALFLFLSTLIEPLFLRS